MGTRAATKVTPDPETEAIVTIGSVAVAHLATPGEPGPGIAGDSA